MTSSSLLRALPVAILVSLALAVGVGSTEDAVAQPLMNGRIAFESDYPGEMEIMSVDTFGQDPRIITNSDPGDYMPAYAPDGYRIAFASARDGLAGGHEIYVSYADGSQQRRLTVDPAIDSRPAWSPDGNKIAFMSNREGGCADYWAPACNYDIYVMTSDGLDLTRLTDNPANDSMPAWSPDGTKIAFASGRDGNNEIYVMNTDGSGQTRLTNDPHFDSKPAWSPDGNRIAWDSDRDGDFEIYTMDPDGTDVLQVTDNQAEDGFPAYSPDGEWIAFNSDRTGNYEIWLATPGGANQSQLTNLPFDEFAPTWQPILVLRWGDLDCSGEVDPVDALKELAFLGGLEAEQHAGCPGFDDPGEISWGDVACDQDIDAFDSVLILRHVAGLPPTQTPPNCHQIGEILVPG